jgi:uncharacterized protein (DUF169 family)
MENDLKEQFVTIWRKYFDSAELPITFYYTDDEKHAQPAKPGSIPRCIIAALVRARKGESMCFDVQSVGCFGGKRWLGFTDKISDDFEYFLSCGLPGKREGERYKKSPELVKETMKYWSGFKAPGRFVVFKRWDKLEESDDPEVVIFFATPDVLSGLFTLASFDEPEPNATFTPMGSGCSSIIQYPYLEKDSKRPRAVIGMFDPSARPFVPDNMLTFSVPMKKFTRMIKNVDESFLITDTWKKIQKRISPEKQKD